MPTKVLVFESDAGFAEELRKGLSGFGCQTTVVDDANAGLQAAAREKPDLILLSIELPRMNGFSVCNKLKRDSGLKNVPLIIMSSDSTEETFEQHRRLRTRAEDYVHKPISFGDLISRAQAFIRLESAPPSEDSIVIDDDIEIEEADVAEIEDLPAISRSAKLVDQDVNDFAEQAFGAIVESGPRPSSSAPPDVVESEDEITIEEPSFPPPAGAGSIAPAGAPPEIAPESIALESLEIAGAESVEVLEPAEDASHAASPLNGDALPRFASEAPRPTSVPPRAASVRPPSIAPRPADGVDVIKLKEELDRSRTRIREVEDELRAAQGKLSALEEAQKRGAGRDAEVQRLQRELDETKAKLASGKGAGSAREFLDLREQLNRKDKDILELRDQLTHKDKDLLAARDHALALDRDKADLGDRIAELEKQTVDLNKVAEIARTDKEQANKRAEDFKRKSEKIKTELDARVADLAEAKLENERLVAERGDHEAALRAEHEATLKRTVDAQRIAIAAIEEEGKKLAEEAVARARAEAEQEKQKALEEAAGAANAEKLEAVALREAELRKEHESKLAALHRANEEALARLRAENVQALAEAEQAAEQKLAERQAELSAAHETAREELAQKHAEELATLREWKEQGEAQRDARIAALEAELGARTGELSSARATLAERETAIEELAADLETRGRDLAATRDTLTEREARLAELESALAERVKELTEARSTLENRNASIASLEAALAAGKGELERAQADLASERYRVGKARGKWDEDRASLERAKDALAAALAQIEEAETRPIE